MIIVTLDPRVLPNCFKFNPEPRLNMELEFQEGLEPNLEGFLDDPSIWVSPGPVGSTVGDKSISTVVMTSALSPPDLKGLNVTLVYTKSLVPKDTGWKN